MVFKISVTSNPQIAEYDCQAPNSRPITKENTSFSFGSTILHTCFPQSLKILDRISSASEVFLSTIGDNPTEKLFLLRSFVNMGLSTHEIHLKFPICNYAYL